MENNFKIINCNSIDEILNQLPSIEKDGSLKGIFKKESSRLKDIIDRHNVFGIVGDNDVDGTTATAITYKSLNYFLKTVHWKIPNRYVESYSLSEDIVDELITLGVTCIILVDTGIAAIEAVDYAKMMGLEVIILDHHQHLEDELPPADLIVTPYVTDNILKTKDVCAAMVTFLVFRNIIEDQSLINELAELAAIATITDCMPSKNENRIIVDYLINRIRNNQLRNFGLKNLIANTSIVKSTFDYTDVSFGLGPLGNSAGRIDCYKENKFCKLLMSNSLDETSELVKMLILFNEKRKRLTEEFVSKAIVQVDKQQKDKFIVVYLPDCPPGVVGIIASKIVEKTSKPTFIFGGEKILKGSARSYGEYNLIGNMRPILEKLAGALSYGGHEGAMGCSFDSVENLRTFKKEIEKSALAPCSEARKIDVINTPLCLNEVNNILNKKGYYDSEKPLFLLSNVTIKYCGLLPEQTQHSFVEFVDTDNKLQRIMFFFEALDWRKYKDKKADLVVSIKNKTNGIELQCQGIILKE